MSAPDRPPYTLGTLAAILEDLPEREGLSAEWSLRPGAVTVSWIGALHPERSVALTLQADGFAVVSIRQRPGAARAAVVRRARLTTDTVRLVRSAIAWLEGDPRPTPWQEIAVTDDWVRVRERPGKAPGVPHNERGPPSAGKPPSGGLDAPGGLTGPWGVP